MSWIALEVNTAPESRGRLGAWLVEQTGQAIEERDDGTLVAYAGTTEAAGMLDRALRGYAESPVTVVHRLVPDVDWSTSWRDGIIVRQFGRLTLSPTWLAESAGGGPRVILDPETAFGSGEHGSTRAALTLLDRHVKPGDRVLDLGSGSGILSIAAVKLGAAWAVGVEVDEESIPVAERNAEHNGVTDQVQFIHGDAADVAPLFAPVDLVLSNILRVVNVALLPEVVASLRPGGIAIFSGMEEPEEPLFLPELAAAGFSVVDEARDAGWWAVAARR